MFVRNGRKVGSKLAMNITLASLASPKGIELVRVQISYKLTVLFLNLFL